MLSEESPSSSAAEVVRWRALFDHLPALVAFWDRDLRNVVANQAYLHWFGLTPDQVNGRHIREVLGEAVFRANLPHITGALAGEEQHFDRTLVTAAGETRHLQSAYIPHHVGDAVEGFYVLATDITGQVEAQRDLSEAQELARMGNYSFWPGTGRLELSPGLMRILGRDPDGPTPSVDEYLSAVHVDDRAKVDEVRQRADAGEEYETNYRIVLPDGDVRAIHSRTHQVLDDSGNVVRLRGTMQDETTSQRLADELSTTNRLLTDLVGVLGHDLRQPIGVVSGYLEHLDLEWESSAEDERRQIVRAALRGAGRLETLLQDILDLVHLDSGELAPRPEPLDLAPVIEEVLGHSGIEVVAEVEPPPPLVQADAVHVRQILTNLLSNAARYGRPPFVLSVSVEGADVLVRLRDHGEGVPDDFVPQLFDRFTRATTGVAVSVAGNGFGLYIVRELARANEGDVWYDAADPGALFTLRLPLRTDRSDEPLS